MKDKILCLDDDPTTQTIIKIALQNYSIIVVSNLKEAEEELNKSIFSAAILDVELPDGDGIHFYSRLKQTSQLNNIPVLFISGHEEITNKLLAFSIGADDYISKPFNPLELNARVTSKIMKNLSTNIKNKVRTLGDLEIDLDRQKVSRLENGNEIDLYLTTREQKILIYLSSRIEQVFSRDQILNNVWADYHIADRTVDSHIAHLRKKVQDTFVSIQTVKNCGYKLVLKKTNQPEKVYK
jgi:DNA-binding response OmpR family regulator